jgi:hypothetical protein
MNDVPFPTPARRSHPRLLAKDSTKVTCFTREDGPTENVARGIVNLSETGICLLTGASLEMGQAVEVHLNGGPEQTQRALGSVIWCRPATDGLFHMGIQFHSPLTPATVAALASS